MARRDETLQRTRTRVQDLIKEFGSYVDAFEQASLFTGPSLCFHFKTLERLMPADRAAHAEVVGVDERAVDEACC
jgi:hypothetical protein